MNLPKRSSFKSVLKVYTLSNFYFRLSLLIFFLENACYSWCMHQTGLFNSASVVPQSKFTGELWSSASVVPQSKSTELCSSAAVIPQGKSTEMWSSAAAFHHDVWYFQYWTNEHFRQAFYRVVTRYIFCRLIPHFHLKSWSLTPWKFFDPRIRSGLD